MVDQYGHSQITELIKKKLSPVQLLLIKFLLQDIQQVRIHWFHQRPFPSQ